MSARFQIISPVDDSIYLEREIATEEQIEKNPCSRAQKAQINLENNIHTRSVPTFAEKSSLIFMHHAEEIGKEITWQMGTTDQLYTF